MVAAKVVVDDVKAVEMLNRWSLWVVELCWIVKLLKLMSCLKFFLNWWRRALSARNALETPAVIWWFGLVGCYTSPPREEERSCDWYQVMTLPITWISRVLNAEYHVKIPVIINANSKRQLVKLIQVKKTSSYENEIFRVFFWCWLRYNTIIFSSSASLPGLGLGRDKISW